MEMNIMLAVLVCLVLIRFNCAVITSHFFFIGLINFLLLLFIKFIDPFR